MNTTLGKTGYPDLAHSIPCKNDTEHDINTTISASQVIAASGTALFYLGMFSLGILGVCCKSFGKLACSQGTFFAFLIGALTASVNVFTNADDLQVKLYCRIFTMFLVGTVFAMFGAALFFERPETGQQENHLNHPTLGRQQPSMGLVVTLITIPLIVIEIVLLIAARASKKTDEPAGMLKYKPWIFVLVDKSTYLAQKIIQVIIYLYLRNTIICREFKMNAQFYFRVLAFFNLIEWVDSQVNVISDVRLSGVDKEFDDWFNFVTDLYTALIIDYRLLCALLFLEHSMEIHIEDNETGPANGLEGNVEGIVVSNMTPWSRQMKTIGFIVGFCCLVAPLFCALYYVNKLHLRPWVSAFAIIVNTAIVVCGTCLLCSNDLEEEENKESHGVKIMVCCMGAVGFTCWMMKAVLACFWAATEQQRKDVGDDPSYIPWDAAKFIVRCFATAFLMGLFMKVNARAFPLKNPDTKINHILVPIIMLGILSLFAESLIDQYIGVDKIFRCEIEEQSMKILFEVSFLGSVGLTCWMVKAPIPGYWAATASNRIDIHDRQYFAWVSAKYIARSISSAFLMGLLLKVDAVSLAQKNPEVKTNHFFVPAVMLAILGAFSETLIDQYVGPVDSKLRCEIKDLSLNILFEAGPPMYLGFLIHMFLHFIIIETEIIKRSGTRVRNHVVGHYGPLDDRIWVSEDVSQ